MTRRAPPAPGPSSRIARRSTRPASASAWTTAGSRSIAPGRRSRTRARLGRLHDVVAHPVSLSLRSRRHGPLGLAGDRIHPRDLALHGFDACGVLHTTGHALDAEVEQLLLEFARFLAQLLRRQSPQIFWIHQIAAPRS